MITVNIPCFQRHLLDYPPDDTHAWNDYNISTFGEILGFQIQIYFYIENQCGSILELLWKFRGQNSKVEQAIINRFTVDETDLILPYKDSFTDSINLSVLAIRERSRIIVYTCSFIIDWDFRIMQLLNNIVHAIRHSKACYVNSIVVVEEVLILTPRKET